MDTVSPARPAPRAVSPGQLEWLAAEVDSWRDEGLLTTDQAEAILGHYRPVRRLGLGRLMLGLGGAFVGVGLIWLVAANLDQLAPLGRFVLVTLLWLAVVAVAHLVQMRRDRRDLRAPSPVVGALRGTAGLAYGAVVFQAAQSLQVAAYEPSLVGFWSLGALLYAYAVRGLAPLLVGVAAGLVWFPWQVGRDTESTFATVLACLVAAVALSSYSVLHRRFGPPTFVVAWRETSALLLLGSLFVAALPYTAAGDERFGAAVVVGIVVTVLLLVAAVVVGGRTTRVEPLVAAAAALAGIGLAAWETGTDLGRVGPEDWARAALSVVVYVAVAGGVATLGILRDSPRLTWLALAALVVFTTTQSFAVFAPIVDGAWLFVVLGAVFLGSGLLFDRGRRELEATLEGSAS